MKTIVFAKNALNLYSNTTDYSATKFQGPLLLFFLYRDYFQKKALSILGRKDKYVENSSSSLDMSILKNSMYWTELEREGVTLIRSYLTFSSEANTRKYISSLHFKNMRKFVHKMQTKIGQSITMAVLIKKNCFNIILVECSLQKAIQIEMCIK